MKLLAQNKRARFDYEILDTYEAGIILTGQEAKSARTGGMNLAGAYVSMTTGKPVLKNAKIAKYAFASNLDGYDPGQDRDLLLHKKEIAKLIGESQEKGVTVMPLEVRGGRTIKVVLGVGRGKKKYDKRQKIKERDVSRKLKRGEDY